MLIRDLREFLHKNLYKGEDWQLMRYFQKGDFGRKPPKYLRMLNPDSDVISRGQANRFDKKRLTDKLSRLVLIIDPDRMPYHYQKQIFKGYQYMVIARFLRFLNAQGPAKTYSFKAFKLGDRYHLPEILHEASEMLMIFSSLSGSNKNFRYYQYYYEEALYQLQLQNRVKSAYHALELHFVNFSYYSVEIENQLQRALKEADKAYRERPLYGLLLYRTRLYSFYHELNHHFKKVIQHWQTFDAYVKNRPEFNHPDHQGESNFKKMGACLNLRDFQTAQKFADQAFKGIDSTNWNWFYFNHIYLLLLTQTGRYYKANQLIRQVFNNRAFKNLPVILRELFFLQYGFLSFIAEAGWDSKATHKPSKRGTFKVYKLINEIHRKSSDKYGLNAVLILLEVLFYFERGNWDALLDKQERLKIYMNRYLRRKAHKRMYYFFRLLHRTIKAGFDPEKVISDTQQTYDLLRNTKYRYEGGYEDLEVIPFEALWKWIMGKVRAFRGQGSELRG